MRSINASGQDWRHQVFEQRRLDQSFENDQHEHLFEWDVTQLSPHLTVNVTKRCSRVHSPRWIGLEC